LLKTKIFALSLILAGLIALLTSLSYTNSEISPMTNIPRIEVPEIHTSEIKLPIVGSAKLTNIDDSQIVNSTNTCLGVELCTTDTIIKIIDGDTIYTTHHKIRLALVDAPEKYDSGFSDAKSFTNNLCPVGSTVFIDQDDGQKTDQYGRMVAKVTCSNINLNEALLENKHATITKLFCKKSEFASESWAMKFGC
jgi:endonuclease YncB( thermonuclease family)